MIKYEGVWDLLCTTEGTVLFLAAKVALPFAFLAGVLKYLDNRVDVDIVQLRSTVDPTSYKSFGAILGFFMIFRTSNAYARYWSGGTLLFQMSATWFGAASSLASYAYNSSADDEAKAKFLHTMIRLMSLLHGLALVDLEGPDGDPHNLHVRLDCLKIIDGRRFDDQSLSTLGKCQHRTELVCYWLQNFIVESMASGVLVLPTSVLNSTFAKLADGLVKLQDCSKIILLPFPFPYAQTTLILLIAYCALTPIMICRVTNFILPASFYSFLVIFTSISLYLVSTELEHPFGDTANDIDIDELQDVFNDRLTVLCKHARTTPFLAGNGGAEEWMKSAHEVRASISRVIQDADLRLRGVAPDYTPASHEEELAPTLHNGLSASDSQASLSSSGSRPVWSARRPPQAGAQKGVTQTSAAGSVPSSHPEDQVPFLSP